MFPGLINIRIFLGEWILMGKRDAILQSDLNILGWVFIPCMCRAFGRFGVVLRGVLDLPKHIKGCAMLYATVKRVG